MDERSQLILHALIREFINSGEPISSSWLFEHHSFGIKPAMIRTELSHLEDAGFLEQPHHSAGRVPTDRAYEVFAEEALGRQALIARNRELRALLEKQAWDSLTDKISQHLGIVSAIRARSADEVYKEGLERLIDHLEWETRDELKTVIHDFEALDDRLARAAEELQEDPAPRVYIGKKSPITRSDHLSVMMGGYNIGSEKIFIVAIGPKRMDYEKVAKLLKGLEIHEDEHDE